VILEALAGGTSSEWGWIQPEVAKLTRVCSYDRAARAWSEASGQTQTLQGTAQALHTLLQNAGESGPYILAGHSIGGVYAREFHSLYPDEVAGIVLVDSAHPQQFDRHPELVQESQAYSEQSASFPLMARFGLFRLFFATGNEIDFGGLPRQQHDELAAQWSSPRYFESQRTETSAAAAIYQDAHHLGSLGNLPLVVITAGTQIEFWHELQAELAALSTDSQHETIPNATHGSLAFVEGDAKRVSELIAGLVAKVRN
jgi:pimeloyl-ACP methyl ester carboxylesterase